MLPQKIRSFINIRIAVFRKVSIRQDVTGTNRRLRKKGQAVFSEPYTDEATGDIVVTISKQLKDGSGVIALDLNLDEVLTASKKNQNRKRRLCIYYDRQQKIYRPSDH